MKTAHILKQLNLSEAPSLTEFNFNEFWVKPSYITGFDPILVEFISFFAFKAFKTEHFEAVIPLAPIFSKWFYEHSRVDEYRLVINLILENNEQLAVENLNTEHQAYYTMPAKVVTRWEATGELFLDNFLSYNLRLRKTISDDMETLNTLFNKFESLHPKLLTALALIGTCEYFQNKQFIPSLFDFAVSVLNKYTNEVLNADWLKDTKTLSIISAVAEFDIATGLELFKKLDPKFQVLIASRHEEFAVEYITNNDSSFRDFAPIAARSERVYLAAIEHSEQFIISGDLLVRHPQHFNAALSRKNCHIFHSDYSFGALVDHHTNQELIDALIANSESTKDMQLYLCESSEEWAKALQKSPLDSVKTIYKDYWKGNKKNYRFRSELLDLPF